MKYLILIHQNRNARAQFASFPAEAQATVVRGGQGTFIQTDGPFAETKEMLAGFSAFLNASTC